jgi:RNA polymerase sigma-70 factor (ECF subfamily)
MTTMMRQFQKLVDEHRHRVHTFAHYYLRNREEAEDVTQDVFLRLWQNLQELDPEHVLAWLMRVTRNACHDVYRKRQTWRGLVQPDSGEAAEERLESWSPGPLADAEASDFQAKMEQALRKLEDPYRTILILREIQDLKYEQIAEMLHLPLNTVKVYLHRGRKRLREELHEVVKP